MFLKIGCLLRLSLVIALVSSNAVNCAKCEKIWIVHPFKGISFFQNMWNVMPLSTALPKHGNLVPRASQVYAVHNKSTPPQQKSCWKISHKGGLMTLDIQIWGGGSLNLMVHPGLRSYTNRSLHNRRFQFRSQVMQMWHFAQSMTQGWSGRWGEREGNQSIVLALLPTSPTKWLMSKGLMKAQSITRKLSPFWLPKTLTSA